MNTNFKHSTLPYFSHEIQICTVSIDVSITILNFEHLEEYLPINVYKNPKNVIVSQLTLKCCLSLHLVINFLLKNGPKKAKIFFV